MTEIEITVLFCLETVEAENEGYFGWVVQGLEYDIAAQGKTMDEAKSRFESNVITQILLDLERGKQPLEGIPPAPSFYLEQSKSAHALEEKERRLQFESSSSGAKFEIPPATIKTQLVCA